MSDLGTCFARFGAASSGMCVFWFGLAYRFWGLRMIAEKNQGRPNLLIRLFSLMAKDVMVGN